jgi:hypothetical protein
MLMDLVGKKVAYFLVRWFLIVVVFNYLWMHHDPPADTFEFCRTGDPHVASYFLGLYVLLPFKAPVLSYTFHSPTLVPFA